MPISPAIPDSAPPEVEAFIARWTPGGGAERANYQMFLSELCDLLKVSRPDPAGPENGLNQYVFDRSITRIKPDGSSSTVYADLYKRGCFMLETKQGAHAKRDHPRQLGLVEEDAATYKAGHGVRGTKQWDLSLEKAYNQARLYIRDLPADEGRPPFLIVCDVGYVIELYAEFTRTGGTYLRFPDPKSYRIYLDDLRRPEIRVRLRAAWTDPLSLDPSKHAARVTRAVAEHLSLLAKSLEEDGHHAQAIATFLQRCLFTFFAEDVGLLPENAFLGLLKKAQEHPQGFVTFVEGLWKEMATGTDFSPLLMQQVAHFNGGLFENASALRLSPAQIALLIGAARSDWAEVEPAIFGTLLERALSPRDRHKLGAHYTPRSYVERLVKPTVIDPLRERWENVRSAAAQYQATGQLPAARSEVKVFHHYLCSVRVLDPACGSGNFLYVTLEHMKRLEGEVLELLEALGDDELTFEMQHFKVRPQQFLGLEKNAQAVAIAQLVLWIGYFQWHKRTTGRADTGDRPLLPKEQSIRAQDAVLAYDTEVPRKDEHGQFVTIWDGHTTKTHAVTGREVPDETARIPVYDYSNARRAEWPETDFIVGNPPFIGASRMRDLLGDGYTETLRKAWKGAVPESADFVMFWWEKAAELVRAGKAGRFGFITTNSIHQTFNRRVLEQHLNAGKSPLTLAYAIPDHPWVDSTDGAAVRIAMTVATAEAGVGELNRVVAETEIEEGEHAVELDPDEGVLSAKLTLGSRATDAWQLVANAEIVSRGVQTIGSGFVIGPDEPLTIERRGSSYLRQYLNGRDITDRPRGVYVVDFFGLEEAQARSADAALYQHLLVTVKPERLQSKRASYRDRWWILGEPQPALRKQIYGLDRFVVSPVTSKHRFFLFCNPSILPDQALNVFAFRDACELGILSSAIHVCWALYQGGRLGVGNDPRYNNSRCFETFPFPDLPETNPLKVKIRDLGEQLDALRKRQQAAHPDLTLTGLYNVVEKLRREEPLTPKERQIHDDGLAAVVKQLHDELDTAVLAAYGWADLAAAMPLADRLARSDEDLEQAILARLVALNHERAAEEQRGHVRWLRPEYQNPGGGNAAAKPEQSELDVAVAATPVPVGKQAWPKSLPDKVAALRALLPTAGPDPRALAAAFGKRTASRIAEIDQILTTLHDLGQL